MQRDRITDDIYVFTSDLYAQVNAGVISASDGVVVIDTLPFPEETREIIALVEREAGGRPIYLVFSHYHTDHTLGACLFPKAIVIAHALCRRRMEEHGERALRETIAQDTAFATLSLRLPDVVIEEGDLVLRLGNKTLHLFHAPGHSSDGLAVYVREDRILFAGDVMMPIPYIVDGDVEQAIATLQRFREFQIETLVPGHGEPILRGEVSDAIQTSINYLNTITREVWRYLQQGKSREALRELDVETCGISRIALGGLAPQLHHRNLLALYQRLRTETDLAYKVRATKSSSRSSKVS
ncbi:MAG: MBL fold metallo-hydrolase [Anaerolineae bacterium]|nr:MBL fold metallo-hydrolase [Thermoflexus sp.]MDW8064036.1 MBL fold metallo-hydrolase [Anaerolineae bacterium]